MALNLGVMDSLGDNAIHEIAECWCRFCECVDGFLLAGSNGVAFGEHPELDSLVGTLCRRGLLSLVRDHFLQALEDSFKKNTVPQFWLHFNDYDDGDVLESHKSHEDWPSKVLGEALEKICLSKNCQEKCLMVLIGSLQLYLKSNSGTVHPSMIQASDLFPTYQLMVSSVLSMTLPSCFPEILLCYFLKNLEELNKLMAGESDGGSDSQICVGKLDNARQVPLGASKMDIDAYQQGVVLSKNHILVTNVGKIVRDLRSLGFASVTEDAYAAAIFSLLKAKVHCLAGDDFRSPVLESIKEWILTVPLQFLYALLSYLGDSGDNDNTSEHKSPLASRPSCLPGIIQPSEGLVRWQLRLEYFAYETLQDMRIGKLFEIIVDYPDSSPAIDDLRQCLEYTGQHSKLVDSFISSLRYRLLTAGASTNDILHQYVSTIKALRTIDPSGVFLEAVGEPIKDYLRRRKDTIKCIVTMLTDGTGGNPGETGNCADSLLEELNKESENQDQIDNDDDFIVDDKQAWLNYERWEPDPVEAANPSKGSRSRRKIDILGMVVGIIGSKDQLVNEYRVMLAEKLLNKSDYDIDSEIRTLELLKIHFGECSMQKCEIMLNDLIDSKRTNTNIKASITQPSQFGVQQGDCYTLDIIDATIISSNFWPSIQSESINLPAEMDHLIFDYAKKYHKIKAPRKLLWSKNLGTIKLELQFENRTLQFSVAPVQAAIIMKFQEQTSWTLKDLAAAIGLPADTLTRKICFWTNKGILVESIGVEPDNHVYNLVEETDDNNRDGGINDNCEELLSVDEESGSVASVEEQVQKEMTVYEKFIIGMLTNFGSMTLDRIHNTLKMFCIADLTYDKSLQQLQSFLSSLIVEEKLEIRDGSYFLKK